MTRILVIDDDGHMRLACRRVLTRAGWEVVCAETGDEGVDLLKSGAAAVDAVLLDRLMPGRMTSLEVLAQIRELAPGLPVILMTGSATEETAAEFARAGARGCLAKPFTPAELRETIGRVLGGQSPLSPSGNNRPNPPETIAEESRVLGGQSPLSPSGNNRPNPPETIAEGDSGDCPPYPEAR